MICFIFRVHLIINIRATIKVFIQTAFLMTILGNSAAVK